MTVEDAAAWLFARRANGVRWGLERTRDLLAGADDPHRRFHSVLVGGTNGKGSVAAMCESVLRQSAAEPAKIGLYTSPHLVDFRERIRIGGSPVDPELFLGAVEHLRPRIDATGATFFEATTAAAFLCFARAGVELAVVEVGLGGRLDATNVLDPLVSAVTNISLEHTEYLGTTTPAIAREKAGIFRRGRPAITAESSPEALVVLAEAAAAAGTSLERIDSCTAGIAAEPDASGTRLAYTSSGWGELRVRVPLPGPHQVRNALLAIETLGLLPANLRPRREAIAAGIATTRWPGRLQRATIRGTTWLFDVAHNLAGVATLTGALPSLELPRPWVGVAGILSDKPFAEMLDMVAGSFDALVLTTAPSAPEGRRWDPATAATRITSIPVRVIPDFEAALARAATMAPHGTVIVTGSVHTVGDAMRELGVPL